MLARDIEKRCLIGPVKLCQLANVVKESFEIQEIIVSGIENRKQGAENVLNVNFCLFSYIIIAGAIHRACER